MTLHLVPSIYRILRLSHEYAVVYIYIYINFLMGEHRFTDFMFHIFVCGFNSINSRLSEIRSVSLFELQLLQ